MSPTTVLGTIRTATLVAVVAGLFASGSFGPAAAQTTLRVVAYNVKHGEGMDSVVDLERIADVLRPLNADVITLQEIDVGVERTDGVDQARRLGELLGMSSHFGMFMPYQGGEYGMAVLSRRPVVQVVNHRLPDGDEPRTALEVVVAAGPNGEPVSVVGVHLYRTPEERLAQAMAMSSALEARVHPVVLAGDFNSVRGDVVMQALDEEGWHLVEKSGPRDTFPADAPEREIDFVMLRPASPFELVEHRVVGERVASDHRPLLAVFRMW
ncbi:MAG: endonuclease/exonuclease/phosphatase family protein [Gemmatimonadota bacterium]